MAEGGGPLRCCFAERWSGSGGTEGNDDGLDLASVEAWGFLRFSLRTPFYTDGLQTVLEERTRHAVGCVEAVHPQPLHVAHV